MAANPQDHHRDASEDPHGDHYADENAQLGEVHREVHDKISELDPTDSSGRGLLLAGFVGVLVLALAVMVVVALVIN